MCNKERRGSIGFGAFCDTYIYDRKKHLTTNDDDHDLLISPIKDVHEEYFACWWTGRPWSILSLPPIGVQWTCLEGNPYRWWRYFLLQYSLQFKSCTPQHNRQRESVDEMRIVLTDILSSSSVVG